MGTQFTVTIARHWANTLLKPGNQKSYVTDQSSNKEFRVSLLSGSARHTQNGGTPPPHTAQHRTELLSQRPGNRSSPPSFDLLSLLSISLSVTGDVIVSAAVYPARQRHLCVSAEWCRSLLTWCQFETSRICMWTCMQTQYTLLAAGGRCQQNSYLHKDGGSSSLLMSL